MELIEELINMRCDTEELRALRARNEQRIQQAKEVLGVKWVLHPANSPKKIKQTAFLLSKKI